MYSNDSPDGGSYCFTDCVNSSNKKTDIVSNLSSDVCAFSYAYDEAFVFAIVTNCLPVCHTNCLAIRATYSLAVCVTNYLAICAAN
jgi:hypothetical protein